MSHPNLWGYSRTEDKEASVLPTPDTSLSLNTGAVRTTWGLLPHCTLLCHPGSGLSAWDLCCKPWECFPPSSISDVQLDPPASRSSPFDLRQELGLKDPSGLEPL